MIVLKSIHLEELNKRNQHLLFTSWFKVILNMQHLREISSTRHSPRTPIDTGLWNIDIYLYVSEFSNFLDVEKIISVSLQIEIERGITH